ncbi:putative uncharacterized protein [Clostridium sp. CAG:921]|nr:putative uncharacterized protein [Clostridium sp. CAG:921]
MKSINLKSLVNIYLANNREIPKEYQQFIGDDYSLSIKKNEIEPLVQLVENIEKIDIQGNMNKYNHFYIGYQIPQIGKEFDLLRLDEQNILNIEYKREINDLEKIKKQLIRNRYYLSFLNRNSILIGYIQDIDKLYLLKNEDLEEISYIKLLEILNNNLTCQDINLNNVFKASNYLISPFNKTNEFMNNQYFLTKQQEEIKNKIIEDMQSGEKNFLIQGDAGTGKTLLIYDLAKQLYKNNKKVAIIHCGLLNQGHGELISKYNWNIYSIREYFIVTNNNFDVVFIDEIQRINVNQFEQIMNYSKKNNSIIICSGDKKQILKASEGGILEKLEKQTLNKYTLSKKIRTNKELANFIKVILDLNKKQELCINTDNIDIIYFNNYIEANRYISSKKDYSFISYTPTLFRENGLVGFEITCDNENTVGNSHKVIGQEFENVGVIIDKHFYYDENNKLRAMQMYNNVYSPKNMLYQALTRVIETLEIIVVENIEIFNILIEQFKN